MPNRQFRLSLLIAAALVLPWAATLHGGEDADGEQPITIGRQFKAMPWLAELGDTPFEVVKYEDIPMLTGLPAHTAYYQIDPDVVISAYSYFFFVRGVDSEYVVGSFVNLAKLCRELEVLEEVKARNKGKEFASGIGEGVKSIGTGLANLVIHPGLSLKSAGTRIRQTGRALERAVGAEDKVGRDESGADRSHLGSGPAGGERRLLAAELGVDVYTSNPVMQKALVDMSQLRTAGGLTTWAIPFHLGMLSYFNPIFGDEKTELLIRDYEPYELRRLVGERLESVFGMDREDRNQPLANLLYNPNFTPREIAYIGLDFEALAAAGNLDMLLKTLAAADTPEEADMLSLELRLYAFLHRRIQPLGEFAPFKNIFAGIGANGRMYLVFPGDTLRPWRHTADAFAAILDEAAALGATGLEVWCLGDVDAGMVENAAGRGVVVRQNILRDPVFFPAPEQLAPTN